MSDDRKKLKELSPVEKYYSDLAEVYINHYEGHINRELNMMLAKGVIVEMESDLQKYHKINSQDERSKQMLTRLNILRDAVDMFGSIASANSQMKIVTNKYHEQVDQLKEENENLRKELMVMQNLINEQD